MGGASAADGGVGYGEEVTSVSEALTNEEVFGFESASGWSASAGTLALSNDRAQGDWSLAVSNVGYTTLTSAALSSLPGLVRETELRII